MSEAEPPPLPPPQTSPATLATFVDTAADIARGEESDAEALVTVSGGEIATAVPLYPIISVVRRAVGRRWYAVGW